jgi:hypothetical protein
VKSNALILLVALGVVSSLAGRVYAKGQGAQGQQGQGHGPAAVATATRGETPGQLLRDAARDTRIVADLAEISSALRSPAAAGITSAATVAGYVDMVAAALKKEAADDTTLAQSLMTAGTQRSPGLNKAQVTALAATDKANAMTLAGAAQILHQVVAAQKAAKATPIGVYERDSQMARRLSIEFAIDAAQETREAARLK